MMSDDFVMTLSRSLWHSKPGNMYDGYGQRKIPRSDRLVRIEDIFSGYTYLATNASLVVTRPEQYARETFSQYERIILSYLNAWYLFKRYLLILS
jgi:hypothetical protein